MLTKQNDQIRNIFFRYILAGVALFLALGAGGLTVAHAQGTVITKSSAHYTVTPFTLSDGTLVDETIINGPPKPPPGFDIERQAVSLPEPDSVAGVNILTVPAFNWVFGCSSVSGAMIAAYYDRMGFPNMYTGPTNGGVMPLDNSSWGTWSDGVDTYPNLPLAASHNGVDGRATKGSIDDYWVEYGSTASDPYITGAWTQHTWGDAIGDYMKTSQSASGNTDGSTTFWNWTTSASPLTCADMLANGIQTTDGTYGRKLFYEARGYTVTDCYNQKTDNTVTGGFSFTQLKAEIDAGRPVMLNFAGHTVVAIGYDDSASLVYIHDTWDYSNHTMTWGTSYSGMELLSVSIVNLSFSLQSPSFLTAKATSSTSIALGWKDNSDNETGFKIERKAGDCGSVNSWAKIATKAADTTTYTNTGLTASTTYAYRIKAYNAGGNSTYSSCVSATTGLAGTPKAPTGLKATSVSAGKISLTWTDNSTGETSFKIYRILNGGTSGLLQTTAADAVSYSDTTATGNDTTNIYSYYLKACNATGCSPLTSTAVVPYKPTGLTTSIGSSTEIDLTWTDNSSNETGFQVYRKASDCSSAGTWTLINTTGADATSFNNTGLTSGQTYSYKVRAFKKSTSAPNANGYSVYTGCSNKTTP